MSKYLLTQYLNARRTPLAQVADGESLHAALAAAFPRLYPHFVAYGAAHLSLTTRSDNPARRLYERNGYTVIEERTGRRYARMTGTPGRILMVKPLAS